MLATECSLALFKVLQILSLQFLSLYFFVFPFCAAKCDADKFREV